MTPHNGSTPLRAVFLDAGGTIIHLDRAFILECLARRGLQRTAAQFDDADAAAREHIGELMRAGEPSDDAGRWVAYTATLLRTLACAGADADYVRDLVTQRHREGRLWTHTVAGTTQALQRVRERGHTIGVISNADGRVATFIAQAGLLPHLDFIIDSGTVGVEKPDPAIFRMACARAGVRPEEAIHVGDVYEIDVVGARAAGVRPVLIDSDDRYEHRDCDRIRTIADLPAWLDRLPCS
ncbi:MAG TPA: HAD-IA family hydrolase [Longimicrobiales bacterium]|nr:HAD-IA family hydrolase [Longimicrobiales bacterium]